MKWQAVRMLWARTRARLESARNIERQTQVREELAQRQWDWQVSQKTSIESEIAQAEKEREQTVAALSADEKSSAQAQEALRTQSAALAALTLDEYPGTSEVLVDEFGGG